MFLLSVCKFSKTDRFPEWLQQEDYVINPVPLKWPCNELKKDVKWIYTHAHKHPMTWQQHKQERRIQVIRYVQLVMTWCDLSQHKHMTRLIRAWICNCMASKVQNGIIHPFPTLESIDVSNRGRGHPPTTVIVYWCLHLALDPRNREGSLVNASMMPLDAQCLIFTR